MGKKILPGDDPNAASRKSDHIDLAIKSRTGNSEKDSRFYYEPFLQAHPAISDKMPLHFLDRDLDFPVWVSSMTGGTAKARQINTNLAKMAGHFKLGMGLGSCRSLLFSDEYLSDFTVRNYLGDQPLYANLGIAQVEELMEKRQQHKIKELVHKLEADGLIIHVNPMQEFIQPEGDHIHLPPLETITRVLESIEVKIIVKEVGQGFGPASLRALLQMPLAAIEFGAFGGTNFAALELSRTSEMPRAQYRSLSYVGHSAPEMIEWIQKLKSELGDTILCRQFIISGGISSFLDGFHGIKTLPFPSVYGMASGFLQFALKPYDQLVEQVEKHLEGLKLANAFLQVK